MNHLAKQFLSTHDERSAVELVRLSRCQNFHNLGSVLANFMEKEFPNSSDIKDEQGIMLYYNKKYDEAYFTFKRLLALRGLNEEKANRAIFNQHFCINNIKDRYIHYNPDKMRKVLNQKKRVFPLVTVTITSCKRIDLFHKTVNSFVNCCKDIHLIDEWFCVDDNSSPENRITMQQFYPFIKFYFKNPSEKGHPQSMNIIREHVKTPYTFHMEDDWQFFDRRNYISECLEVLGENPKIGQCLINKNYSETSSDQDIAGGIFKNTPSGLRYFIQEYCHTDEQKKTFSEKHKNCKSSSYWPHFSFRPSLLRTNIFHELGKFNEEISHFEMDYSYRYIKKGYISAFLETTYCLHIGRLTSERNHKDKLNAYDLNDEAQLSGKEEKRIKEYKTFPFEMKTYVVNLKRRADRLEAFRKQEAPKFLQYERFEAVDGSQLVPTSQLQQIFDHNDYNMRQGMVGCAMSHIKLCINLLQDKDCDAYCIMEDDIEFVPEFEQKLLHCAHELNKTEWDMFYLGHHLWEQFIDGEVYSKTIIPKVEQFDRAESLKRSMGGTGGYMINKKGAKKLLDFINRTGMTNGIDTVQQKSADELNVFYAYPHLIYSECYRGDNKPDTDIQYNHTSLTIPIEQRLEEELKHYTNIKEIDPKSLSVIPKSFTGVITETPFYYQSNNQQEIVQLSKESKYPCYTLDDQVLFVVPNGDNGRYFHRFKKNGEWNVDDAIKTKQNEKL
jgi:GR25 family glycosyltransferase involved in LPS biosynthesis